LSGTRGVYIAMSGFRGGISNYTGATSLSSTGPLLLQVYKLQDFEGTVSFGAGTASPACANVTSTANSLRFQFINPPIS